MLTKAEIKRQLKTRQTWTGKQVARVLFANFYSGFKLGDTILSDADINLMQERPRNSAEASKIFAYSKLYISMMDVYNIINSYSEQAIASVALLHNSLLVHYRMLNFRQAQLNMPLMITEQQEKRYLKAYNDYLEKRITLNKKKQETVLSFIMRRDADFLYNFDLDLDYEELHSQQTKHILSQYRTAGISDIAFAHDICDAVFPSGIRDPRFTLTDKQKVWGPAPQDYVEAITNQYNASFDQYHDLVMNEIYKHWYYHKRRVSLDRSLKYALKKFPVDFPKGEPYQMPDDMTKFDFLYKVILPGHLHKTQFDSIDKSKLNNFLITEYGDYLASTVADATNGLPQLRALFDATTRPLDMLGSWQKLFNAGAVEYNPKPNSYKYGKWHGFPNQYRSRVRDNGYAVYHDAGKLNNFDIRFSESNDFLIRDLMQEGSEEVKKQRQHAYDLIEQYLVIYQSYVALIRGIKAWTGLTELDDLINVPNGYPSFIKQATNFNNLLYSEFAEIIKLFTPGKKNKKKIIQLLDNYTPIDIDKKRIPHSTNKALSDFLNEAFAPEAPQNATMLINSIAGGLNDSGGEVNE